ncbi:MAG: HD-GYP domain-containing protein [Phycisphaerae bacterium]|nr:HD-GYP domain-containing protein [Phycisphaerae bacterium]
MSPPVADRGLHRPFFDRCRALGLAMWRCDTAGAIVDEPAEPGQAGLWLHSRALSQVVSQEGRRWATNAGEGVDSVAPGAWIIRVSEMRRRRKVGGFLLLALSPEGLESSFFASACEVAGLDEAAARRALWRFARHDARSAAALALSLPWMVHDAAALSEHEAAVGGFTSELSRSYETIDVLYALGRAMQDIDRPENFVTLLCDRLHQTMDFGYFGVWFDNCNLPGLSGMRFERGAVPPGFDLDRLYQREQPGCDVGPTIVPIGGDSPHLGQLLLQPILTEQGRAGVIIACDKRGDDPQVSSYDTQLIGAGAAFAGSFAENARLYHDHKAMFLGSLRALTAAIDAKDAYTRGHSERVAHVARQLAFAAGFRPVAAERVHVCGLLHDVGKIGVPEAVLLKPGRLSDDEFELIKRHPAIGHGILKDIPSLHDVLPGVLHHHERWDGMGYPEGLAGDKIPLVARVLALADTFDAMSSNRSYRSAMPRERVLAEIAANAGKQFDPELASIFVRLDFAEFDAMVARHASQQALPAAA